jgi:hypothetical protein
VVALRDGIGGDLYGFSLSWHFQSIEEMRQDTSGSNYSRIEELLRRNQLNCRDQLHTLKYRPSSHQHQGRQFLRPLKEAVSMPRFR